MKKIINKLKFKSKRVKIMNTLENKTVVIIGGSQGIGLDTAKEAIAKGANVTIASRSNEKLEKAKAFLNGKVSTYQLDGSNEEEVKHSSINLMQLIILLFPHLELMVGQYKN